MDEPPPAVPSHLGQGISTRAQSTFGARKLIVAQAVQCIVGHLATSPSSTHAFPSQPHAVIPELGQTLSDVPGVGGKVILIEPTAALECGSWEKRELV